MKYEAKNLPYTLFEKIGMTKKDVLGLPKDDLVALLSGRTTSLKDLSIKTEAGEIKEKAKLSVYNLPDNSLAVRVHPIRKEIQNEFGLSTKQIESLKAGELIVANKTSQNGEKEKHIFQLDREINEIKSVRVNSINISSQIENVQISTKQKSDLLEGKPVDLVNKNGEIKSVAIDLVNIKGYTLLDNDRNRGKNENQGEVLNHKDASYRDLLNKATPKEEKLAYLKSTPEETEDISRPNGLKR